MQKFTNEQNCFWTSGTQANAYGRPFQPRCRTYAECTAIGNSASVRLIMTMTKVQLGFTTSALYHCLPQMYHGDVHQCFQLPVAYCFSHVIFQLECCVCPPASCVLKVRPASFFDIFKGQQRLASKTYFHTSPIAFNAARVSRSSNSESRFLSGTFHLPNSSPSSELRTSFHLLRRDWTRRMVLYFFVPHTMPETENTIGFPPIARVCCLRKANAASRRHLVD